MFWLPAGAPLRFGGSPAPPRGRKSQMGLTAADLMRRRPFSNAGGLSESRPPARRNQPVAGTPLDCRQKKKQADRPPLRPVFSRRRGPKCKVKALPSVFRLATRRFAGWPLPREGHSAVLPPAPKKSEQGNCIRPRLLSAFLTPATKRRVLCQSLRRPPDSTFFLRRRERNGFFGVFSLDFGG